jgi:DNA-binding response OmpR family regulator
VDLSLGADSPAYDSGADGYLGKPFEAQDLIDRVRDVDSWSR